MASTFGNMTLGELIDALKSCQEPGEEKTVGFDFAGLEPKNLHSYRGFYDHCALEYGESYSQCDLKGFIEYLESMIGLTVDAWKGGEYEVHRDRPVWVAMRGECFGTGIVDVTDHGYHVTIDTKYLDR